MLEELNQTVSEATGETVAPTEQPAQAPKVETEKEINFRVMRDRAEAAERRAAELERAMHQNMNQQKTTKIEIADDDDFSVDDDSLVEGKHLKKMYKKQSQELKEIKRMLEESSTKTASSNAEWRLKTQYSDFDQVVNEDNIRKLAALKPSQYRSMLANPDLYDKGETAYDMIKSWVMTEKFAAEDKRIEQNKSKPRSSASASPQAGETPLSHIADYDRRVLTEERKEQLRRQVEEAKRFS